MWTQDGIMTFEDIRRSQWRNTMTVNDNNEGYMTYPDIQTVWGLDDVKQTAYEAGSDYVYINSDLKPAYRAANGAQALSNYFRTFVYIRPDTFVVLDRITTIKDYYTKTWLLHWPGIPTITGTAASSTYKGGKLFFKSLSPANPTITSVALVSGFPNNLHRMSVVPSGTNASEIFLNVLYAAASTEVAMPNTVKIDTDGRNMIGVHLKNPVKNIIAMFPTTIDDTLVNGTISYSYSTADSFVKHFLFGLPPNTGYGVSDTGSNITFVPGAGTYRSSSQGVLIYSRQMPKQPKSPQNLRISAQ